MLFDLSMPATQAEIAEVVGISQPTISNWFTEGKLPVNGTLGDVILAYCQRLRDQAAGRLGAEVGGLDLVQERAALAREQRLGIEIKNSVLHEEYAPIVLLSEVLATVSQSVVEGFEQLSGQIKKACPDLPDAARDVVTATLASARNEWVRSTESLVLANADDNLEEGIEVLDV